MRKASTRLLEQGIQTPSPAPDLIPAETENQPRTHIGLVQQKGGTSVSTFCSSQVTSLRHRTRSEPIATNHTAIVHSVKEKKRFVHDGNRASHAPSQHFTTPTRISVSGCGIVIR
jgi:hypothetical protein